MSRVLDALRNLQQPPSASVPSGAKVTPRLAASIRRAVLGPQAEKPTAVAAGNESLLLFRVPELATPVNVEAEAESSVVTLAPSRVEAASVPEATVDSTPDPLSLVDAIAASLRDVAHDDAPAKPSESKPSEPKAIEHSAASRLEAPPAPAEPSRLPPGPTVNELEVFSVLADVRSSAPYRSLLQAVKRDTRALAAPVVALIGLDPQDSTAFVTACLGALFSEEENRRVLLVEGHGTNRMLAKMYGVPHAVGLCEHLAGRLERSQIVVATSQSNLSVLPFGQPHTQQVQPLVGGLAKSLQEVRNEYGMVLVDAGPLDTPWALAVSRSADVTYLLVRLGETLAEQAVANVNRFRAAGGKVSGCIAIDPAEGRRS